MQFLPTTHAFRAIYDYDYIVVLAGLKSMTDSECFGVSYDENSSQRYGR